MAPAKKSKQGVPPATSVRKVVPGGAPRARGQTHQIARVVERVKRYKKALPIAQATPAFNGEYTTTLGETLSDMVADGCTLDNISTLPNMPPLRVMLRWIADTSHPFNKIYYDAKRAMVALYEERAFEAANKPLLATFTTRRQALDKNGAVVDLVEEREVDNVERAKLMVSTHQWTLSHLAPKKHSRQATPITGEGTEQLEALFQSLKTEVE
jgi:hypothetical protein